MPSARFRVRQYVPALRALGVDVREYAAALGSYPPRARRARVLWGPATLASRVPGVLASYSHDLTLLQREMVSTLVTLEPWTRAPRVLDVDDAIFLLRGGRFAERLARGCALTICGNRFLADRFSDWAPAVAVLPTGIDTRRFTLAEGGEASGRGVIGWIGTSVNLRYLYAIEEALGAVLRQHCEAVLRIVTERRPDFGRLPGAQVEWVPWSAAGEVRCIQEMDLGLMPLADTPWERGKCSFKLLQYMACGVPFVASPVGMNAEVLALGEAGLAAGDARAWQEGIGALLAEPAARRRMGLTGRAMVERHFSVDVLAPRLAALLRGAAG